MERYCAATLPRRLERFARSLAVHRSDCSAISRNVQSDCAIDLGTNSHSVPWRPARPCQSTPFGVEMHVTINFRMHG